MDLVNNSIHDMVIQYKDLEKENKLLREAFKVIETDINNAYAEARYKIMNVEFANGLQYALNCIYSRREAIRNQIEMEY
jgi:hypothetical protein